MNRPLDPDRVAREAIRIDLNRPSPFVVPKAKDPAIAATPPSLDWLKAASFAGKPVPERKFHDAGGYIPCEGVTLLYGDGGTGKSLIALQLAISTALGRNWLGMNVRSGPMCYFSAEDTVNEMHRRTDAICAQMGVEVAHLDGVNILPMSGKECVLAADVGKGIIKPTPLFEAYQAAVKAMRPALIIIDNAIDVFAGDQNSASQVKQFMHLLAGLSHDCECPVLLLAHPSKSGMANGSGDAGSVHWSNSARSRLYLRRVVSDDGSGLMVEDDPNARKLSRMKANYAATGEEMDMRWEEGAFVSEDASRVDPANALGAAEKAERVFLHLLRWHQAKGINVSPSASGTYAPSVFAKHPQREGVSKKRFVGALNSLLDSGKICVKEHGPASRRRSHLEVKGSNT